MPDPRKKGIVFQRVWRMRLGSGYVHKYYSYIPGTNDLYALQVATVLALL